MGLEASFLTHYFVLGKKQTLSTGLRYFKGQTQRFQKGVGSTGTDANFTTNFFPTELIFNTINTAWFAEQVIRLSPRFIVIPGFRFENIQSDVSGRLGINLIGEDIKVTASAIQRNFLMGRWI
jgi:Fe(3+) dicitrate transport protein